MRLVYPRVTAMGFGNNLLTLAKAHLIAESCHLTYQPPIWPRTAHMPGQRRGYGYYFPWTLGDRLRVMSFVTLQRLQRRLKVPPWPRFVEFHRKEYERLRNTDVGEACRLYLGESGLDDPASGVVVSITGMWGGYAGIKRARPWIERLLLSHSNTRRQFIAIDRAIGPRLRVGVSIRMGDFLPPGAGSGDRQGERLVRLPLDWYAGLCRRIRALADCEIVLVTDGTPDDVRPFLDEFSPRHTVGQPFTALLGLLLLRSCHLVVCSNSTYSRVACFLNDRPYVWPAVTLVRDASTRYGYLWKNGASPMPAWAEKPVPVRDGDREAVRRCFALSDDVSVLPEGLARYVASGATLPIEIKDDLLYGDPVALL